MQVNNGTDVKKTCGKFLIWLAESSPIHYVKVV